MDEPVRKRTRVGREEWAKRVARWRDSGLTTAEFAAEVGISAKTLTYWAWTLKREATGEKRVWPAKKKRPGATQAAASAKVQAPFVEVSSQVGVQPRFELEVRGRRLHIPHGFDAEQLSSLLHVLESA
ncbi:MAG: hypothetical protein QOI11_161 [Candidatus Eremiobacteraeota bacterium]|jgi:hypothetical protein|nr:hypothetical protein [Candidatus Eremiobacteraeota bacterium]